MIIAIDPGPTESAYVVMDSPKSVIFGKRANEDMLAIIDYWKKEEWLCEKLIIEMIASQGMAVGQTTFETCVWIGRFIERWGRACELIYRHEEKTILCRSARATDSNIRQRLIDLFGGEVTAIGCKKCPSCKGKGVVSRQKTRCEECKGTGWKYPPGVLWKMSGDEWAALAVAVTYLLKTGKLVVDQTRLIKPSV